MLPIYAVFAFAFASVTYLIYHFILTPLFFLPLSKIPSAHWSAPISARWINNLRLNGKTGVAATLSAHRRLGPIVRLSPDEISVASLDGLRKIYSGGFEKDPSYLEEFTNYDGTVNLVSMLGNKEHGMQKRMISHVYSNSYIQNSPDVRKLSEVLVARLFSVLKESEGNEFDAYGTNQAIGADFMSGYLFGLENATNFMRDVELRKKFMAGWMSKFRRFPDEDEATEMVESFVMGLCQAAARTGEKECDPEMGTRPVVYSQFSSQLSKKSTSPLPNKDLTIASEMFDHFIASIETSRVAITYFQWELSRRPDLQRALRKELLALSPPILVGGTSLPDPKAIDALPLLNAILREILRLYPPSPALLTRVTPPAGTTIEGYFVPGNIVVGTSSQCMHQNPSVFPEPQEFKPERWLDKDEEKRKEMNRWFWVFGSGGRMCIGSHYALYMLKLSIGAMYSNFETEIVDDEGIEQEDAFLAGPMGGKLVLRFRAVA